MPLGKSSGSPANSPSKGPLSTMQLSADGSPCSAATSNVVPQTGSDRARIAVLKSDIGLVQVEIDAFRGDPGGVLELQSVLDRFQWSPDAHQSSATKDQLNALLLRKLNELSTACQSKVFSSIPSQKNSLPLLPQNSLVGEIVNFFQLKRLHPAKSASVAVRVSSAGGSSQQSLHRTIAATEKCNVRSPVAAVSPTPCAPPLMAAADPGDIVPHSDSRREICKNAVTPLLHPSEIPRTPPSPIEGLSEEESEEDEDGISWGPQKPGRKSRRRSSIKKGLELPCAVASTVEKAPGTIPMDDVAKLKRQLERAKLQIKFFKSLERHVLTVQTVSDQVQLMAASPNVEVLPTSLKAAVETFFPQGIQSVSAATTAATAAAAAKIASTASPAKKGAKHQEAVEPPPPVSSAAVLSHILNSGPIDEKKLRIAVAFQNSVIEMLTTNMSMKAREDDETISSLNAKVDALQKRLDAQADAASRERVSSSLQLERVGNALRLQTPTGTVLTSNTSLSAWLQPVLNLGGLPSRPLSRASVADGGGLLGFPTSLTPQPGRTQLLSLPPRPESGFSAIEVYDTSDSVFGASATSQRIPKRHVPTARGRPLVATRPEDVEGESERRYLQVIRSQSEIIKELSNRTGTSRTAASSMTTLAALNNS